MSDLAEFGIWTKKVVSGLLSIPAGPLLAILIGLWLARRRRGLGFALIGFGAALLFALSLPIVANGIAAPAERAFPPLHPDVPLPPHTAIVVLGGGLQDGALDYGGGETVNAIVLPRLRSAARLAARTRLPILVSGGRPLSSKSVESDQMADALE
ncbi:MAG: YdcF family protein, partial [Burkholderiaceae bacterium]